MSSDAHTRKSRLTIPSGGSTTTTTTATTPTTKSSYDSSNTPSSTSRYHPLRTGPVPYDWQRLTDWRQMDLQAAMDQMKTLLGTRPQAVYKTAYYRKQTKNHWARDDPAFWVLQAVFCILAGVAYAVAFRASYTTSISFILQSVLWNWWGCGLVVAAAGRALANQHLGSSSSSSSTTATTHHGVRQQVEFWYAFDIHCNAFFPVFVLLCEYTNKKCCC